MQLLYNSDSFVVVQFDVPAHTGDEAGRLTRGGYEIVDKFARKEIFLEGLLAERFQAGVQELVSDAGADGPSVEAIDDYIAGFTALAQQPLHVH